MLLPLNFLTNGVPPTIVKKRSTDQNHLMCLFKEEISRSYHRAIVITISGDGDHVLNKLLTSSPGDSDTNIKM